MNNFFEKCSRAGNGEFKRALSTFLDGLGLEFLRIIQDEIIRRKVMDTRHLLASFHKGESENVWEISEGGLTLTVGTNASYATFVNDGHWTCEKGVERRFVPGYWENDRFIYDPSSDSGMVLKQQWVKGKHYWESGIKILERLFPLLLEEMVSKWMDSYFR